MPLFDPRRRHSADPAIFLRESFDVCRKDLLIAERFLEPGLNRTFAVMGAAHAFQFIPVAAKKRFTPNMRLRLDH